MTVEGNIKIVIGSWGSYNECNERALGSKWLDLSNYSDWEEIQEELQKEGFILDGIDEELFIQDIEGLPSGCKNWDYTNPQKLFETLYESGVLEDEYQYDVLMAYLEVRDFDDFEELYQQFDKLSLQAKADREAAYQLIAQKKEKIKRLEKQIEKLDKKTYKKASKSPSLNQCRISVLYPIIKKKSTVTPERYPTKETSF